MLKTYLFIPANRVEFLQKINQTKSNYFIIDFEESIPVNERLASFENMSGIDINDFMWARVPLNNDTENVLDFTFLEQALKSGFSKIVLPKISGIDDIRAVKTFLESNSLECEFMLLVENPSCLMNLHNILASNLLNIQGVALGSHDYCNSMGMRHTIENLSFARNLVLNLAKAYKAEAIDIVSMDLSGSNELKNECLNAFSLGFDAKFTLHPKQLEAIQSIQFYTDEEIKEAQKVYTHFENIDLQEFSVLSIDGVLYEKPHVQKIVDIIDWLKRYGNK